MKGELSPPSHFEVGDVPSLWPEASRVPRLSPLRRVRAWYILSRGDVKGRSEVDTT